jgi:hypothetical protein
MNNGARKGGEESVMKTLRSAPGLEAIYQVHRNVRTRDEDNAPAEFIANQDEECAGDFLTIRVEASGKSYTVAAGANGKPQRFASR